MKIQLACQTITWGENQREHFDTIFPAISHAGFDGVEIGFRHIKDIPPEQFKEQLADNRLQLSAIHIGGNLEEPDQAGGERSMLEQVLDYLRVVECSRLIFSGLDGESASAVAEDITMLGRAADLAAEQGMQLLYHNHHWEFLRPGIMEAMLNGTPPSLGLCPDVGWLYRADVDVMEFLATNVSRIKALHFKDFASPGDGKVSFNMDTVPLGQGLVPLREVAKWLHTNPIDSDQFWVVAEQDFHKGPVEEAAKLNAAFMHDVLAS